MHWQRPGCQHVQAQYKMINSRCTDDWSTDDVLACVCVCVCVCVGVINTYKYGLPVNTVIWRFIFCPKHYYYHYHLDGVILWVAAELLSQSGLRRSTSCHPEEEDSLVPAAGTMIHSRTALLGQLDAQRLAKGRFGQQFVHSSALSASQELPAAL